MWVKQGKRVHNKLVTFSDVLYVPELRAHLLSCSTLCRDEYVVNFGGDCCVGLQDGTIQFQAKNRDGVYRLNGRPLQALIGAVHATKHERSTGEAEMESVRLWHNRLGHAHFESLRKLERLHAVTGLKIGKSDAKSGKGNCESCVRGKQTRESLSRNKHRSTEKGATIHTDGCGPMSVKSLGGSGTSFLLSMSSQATRRLCLLRTKAMFSKGSNGFIAGLNGITGVL